MHEVASASMERQDKGESVDLEGSRMAKPKSQRIQRQPSLSRDFEDEVEALKVDAFTSSML